ncbi:MAG: HD domain-containing protein [Rhodocyclales bacterium]|nr:HD domain-containing protein [Rhodocyclales bacterium]
MAPLFIVSLFVNLRSVVHALSDSLDLVGINDVHHGKRVGIMAVEILRALGWSQADQETVFDAGLLHDIGVSSSDLHHQLIEDFDWEGSQGHAELGAYLLAQFPPLAHLAPAIRLHHTHWSETRERYGKSELVGNLIFLADRIDVLAAVAMLNNELLEQIPAIRARIAAQSGAMFDPDLVTVFLDVSRKEAFWLGLEAEPVRDYMEDVARGARQTETSLDTLQGVASLFSHVVDAKSRFTVEHSEGVARIARHLGGVLGASCELDDEECAKLELAGYLHDLGKLRVPDAILDKPGPLDAGERRQIASHAYETYRILSRIPGFEDIARWAAFHHETADGEGYPFRLKGGEVPLQARLLRAADIFQALSQNRPYREALPAQHVLDHMKQMSDGGQLDRYIYQIIARDLQEIYRLAQPHPV